MWGDTLKLCKYPCLITFSIYLFVYLYWYELLAFYFTQWFNICHYHYLFDPQIPLMWAVGGPLHGFCVPLAYPHHSLSTFLFAGQTGGSILTFTFSSPVLVSAISPESHSSLLWRIIFRSQIWAFGVLIAAGVSLLPVPLSGQN